MAKTGVSMMLENLITPEMRAQVEQAMGLVQGILERLASIEERLSELKSNAVSNYIRGCELHQGLEIRMAELAVAIEMLGKQVAGDEYMVDQWPPTITVSLDDLPPPDRMFAYSEDPERPR